VSVVSVRGPWSVSVVSVRVMVRVRGQCPWSVSVVGVRVRGQ
jgi:hypothetical protein